MTARDIKKHRKIDAANEISRFGNGQELHLVPKIRKTSVLAIIRSPLDYHVEWEQNVNLINKNGNGGVKHGRKVIISAKWGTVFCTEFPFSLVHTRPFPHLAALSSHAGIAPKVCPQHDQISEKDVRCGPSVGGHACDIAKRHMPPMSTRLRIAEQLHNMYTITHKVSIMKEF